VTSLKPQAGKLEKSVGKANKQNKKCRNEENNNKIVFLKHKNDYTSLITFQILKKIFQEPNLWQRVSTILKLMSDCIIVLSSFKLKKMIQEPIQWP
jgi:hypothetical protein